MFFHERAGWWCGLALTMEIQVRGLSQAVRPGDIADCRVGSTSGGHI